MPSISETIAAGLAHHQAGRVPEAENAYRQVLAADPQNVAAWHLLGRLAQQGRLDVAIRCIEQAVQLRPDYAEAFLDLGTAFRDAGNLEQAIASFQRSMALNPRFAEANYNLGLAFHGQERLEQAIACYERTLELRPDMAQAHYNLGVAFENQGRLTEAVACCRRSLQFTPTMPAPFCSGLRAAAAGTA